MAENAIPQSIQGVLDLLEQNRAGAHELELTLGLHYNKEADIIARRQLLLGKNEEYEDADDEVDDAYAQQKVAISNGREFLTTARDILKKHLGSKPSVQWKDAGWSETSIAVPSTREGITHTLEQQVIWLADHPTHEVATAPFNYTGANAQALLTALQSAKAAINVAEGNRTLAKGPRDAALAGGQDGIRSLLDELENKLDPLSGDWQKFGFNRPGAVDTPEKLVGFALTAQGEGRVLASWPPVPRASRVQVFGLDGDGVTFELVDSSTGLSLLMQSQPLGLRRYKARGVNSEGDTGPFSDEAEITVT